MLRQFSYRQLIDSRHQWMFQDQEQSTQESLVNSSALASLKHRALSRDIRKYLVQQSRAQPSTQAQLQLAALARRADWRLRSRQIQILTFQLADFCRKHSQAPTQSTLESLLFLRDERVFLQVIGLIRTRKAQAAKDLGHLVNGLLTVLGWYSDQINEEVIWQLVAITQQLDELDQPPKHLQKLCQLLLKAPSPNFLVAGIMLLTNLVALSKSATTELLNIPAFNSLVLIGANTTQGVFSETATLINNVIAQSGVLREANLQFCQPILSLFVSLKCPAQELLVFLLSLRESQGECAWQVVQLIRQHFGSRVAQRLRQVSSRAAQAKLCHDWLFYD